MKRVSITITLLMASIYGLAQALIDDALREEMNRRGDDEQIEVVVLMKAQYDRAQLCRYAGFSRRKLNEEHLFSMN
jgi:hypothetical protein